MSAAPRIRPATTGDLDALARLWLELVREQEALDPRLKFSDDALDRWRSDAMLWVRSDTRCVRVAESPNGIVGFLSAEQSYRSVMFEERLEVYVTEIYVAERYRDRGTGAALLNAARDWAAHIGASAVTANVLTANDKGRRFWAEQGASSFYETVRLPLDGAAASRDRPGKLGF